MNNFFTPDFFTPEKWDVLKDALVLSGIGMMGILLFMAILGAMVTLLGKVFPELGDQEPQ